MHPSHAIAISARYFVLRTLYNQPPYWILVVVIVGAGALDMLGWISWLDSLVLVVGIVEVVFAIVFFVNHQRGDPAR